MNDLQLKILGEYGVGEQGLTEAQTDDRRQRFGFNEVKERREPRWKMFVAQFQNVMVYILFGAVAVSVIVPLVQHGSVDPTEMIDAIVIFAIILINAVFGFAQEWRAENAIAMLHALSAPQAKVRRGGRTMYIASRELLPGDLMILEAGDRVSADARIALSSSLEINESTLTGESVPVAKQAEKELSAGLGSAGAVYSGTMVTRGFAEVVVTATGAFTEIGKITSMMMSLKPPETPLQLELKRAGSRIGIAVLILCSLIFAVGIARGIPLADIFFTAVTLAVAAVPEGLPAIVTVCLAIGVQRMVKHRALIRRLDAIETLGSITVICADKTGTMTMNQMHVEQVLVFTDGDEELAARIGASCNRAELPDIGDPTEVALLVHAEETNAPRLRIEAEDVPFTSEAKYMVTSHTVDGKTVKYWKGAPEVIAGFCDESQKKRIHIESQRVSEQGLRVLAVAEGNEGSLRCVGLIALLDPPRPTVREAIARALTAGIRTIMITGDHPATALAIATRIGIRTDGVIDGITLDTMSDHILNDALKNTSVFARVRPEHKVRILELLQKNGEIVAMSGDGINDAPALKRAHVGVAMGLKGTDVAREAGAMILTDDDYATIVEAVAEGRRIYDNIKKFVVYLMRCNTGEVFIVASALLLGMPLPLLPLHILWINLVTDSFPALALAAEPPEHSVMHRSPRKKTHGIFTGEWGLLLAAGVLSTILTLGIFAFTASHTPNDLALARSAALTSSIIFQMLLAFSARTVRSAFTYSPFGNRWMLGAVTLSLTLHVLLLISPFAAVFSLAPIPAILWEEIIASAFVAFAVFEGCKFFGKKR